MKFGARLSRKPSCDGSVGSGALHALKKAGFSLRRSNPEPLEYTTAKTDLDAAVKSLVKLLETSEASRRAWQEVVRCKNEFGERFLESVGEAGASAGSDDGFEVINNGIGARGGIGVKLVSDGSRGFQREVSGSIGNDGIIDGGLKETQSYIKLLKDIQGKYKIVARAKSEYEFYMKKLKGLQGRQGKEDALARTQDKFDLSKGLFIGYVTCMVKMIRAALEKKEAAFQALFDTHYLLQAKMVSVMTTHESSIHTRAMSDEQCLTKLNLCSGLEDPTEKFDGISCKCQEIVKRQSNDRQLARRAQISMALNTPAMITAPPQTQETCQTPLSLPASPPRNSADYLDHPPPPEELPMPSAPTESVLALGAR